eukprot:3775129-Pleurochrysis_carterae.AAC.1
MCITRNLKRAERARVAERVALRGGANRVRARRLGHNRHSTPGCLGWGMVVFDPEVWIRGA